MKYIIFLFLISINVVTGYENRSRVYGNIAKENGSLGPVVNGHEFNFRTGGSGYTTGGDLISVGKLTCGDCPYAGLEDDEIAQKWMFLRKTEPLPSSWLNPANWSSKTGDAIYRTAMSGLGVSSDQMYKKEVLEDQILSEEPLVTGYINDAIEFHESNGNNSPQLYFEVGNEPNIYPYIPPDLYAWYYLKWRNIILDKVAQINSGRSSSEQITPNIMPGGLWIFDGMPEALLDILNNGITVKILSADPVKTSIPYSAWEYWDHFVDALSTPLFCEGTASPISGSSGYIRYQCRDSDYDLGNVYNFTFSEYCQVGGSCNSNPPTSGAYLWDAIVGGYSVTPVKDLIDIGNLHFYPYLSVYSTSDIHKHLDQLDNFANHVAADVETGDIWITELGNFNAFTEQETINKMMIPSLQHLRNNPIYKRWYWFQDLGEDSKFQFLPPGGLPPETAYLIATGIEMVETFIEVGTLGIVEIDHHFTFSNIDVMVDVANAFGEKIPFQGLYNEPTPGVKGTLRNMGDIYEKLSRTEDYFIDGIAIGEADFDFFNFTNSNYSDLDIYAATRDVADNFDDIFFANLQKGPFFEIQLKVNGGNNLECQGCQTIANANFVPATQHKTGIFLKKSLSDDSENLFFYHNNDDQTIVSQRTAVGTNSIFSSMLNNDEWLKMNRWGDKIIVYTSTNGNSWSLVNSYDISNFNSDAFVGIGFTSSDEGSYCSSCTGSWNRAGQPWSYKNYGYVNVSNFSLRSTTIVPQTVSLLLLN